MNLTEMGEGTANPAVGTITPPSSSPTLVGKGENFAQLVLLVGVLTMLLIRWYGGGGGQRKEKVPVAKSFLGIPIIEGLYNVYQADRYGLKFIEGQVKKYGYCFEMPVGLTSAYCVSDATVIQKLLTSTNPNHLSKAKEFREILLKDFLEDVLWAADADVWAPHKKILSRSFTHQAVRSYLGLMNGNGKRMSQDMMKRAETTDGCIEGGNVFEELNFHTARTMAEIILGTAVMSDEELVTFLKASERIKELVVGKAHKPYLLINAVWQLHPDKREMTKMVQFHRDFITNIINKYREKRRVDKEQGIELEETLDDGDEENDSNIGVKPFRSMLEEMIHGGMGDLEIVNEAMGMIFAGYETTSMALNTLMFHLALHPEYQKLCRDEVDSFMESKMLQDDLDCELSMEDVTGLKYLERCILENMRLTPTFPVFIRRLDEPLFVDDFELEGNGKNVIMIPWCLHRNPEYYPNPEIYDPDRFLPENVKQRPFYSYVPFAGGPKVCMGMKLAMIEMKMVMFWILRYFEIQTTDKMEDITFRIDITLQMVKPCNLIFKRRNRAVI